MGATGALGHRDGGGDGRAGHGRRDRPRLTPTLEVDPAGGQVMVTRFECPSLRAMVVLVVRHGWIERQVSRRAEGYLGAVLMRDWRTRTLLSISCWRDLDSVYSMGSVPRHITGSRLPARLGVHTRAGVFCYAGDWRRVLFGAGVPKPSPLDDRVRRPAERQDSDARTS